MPTTPRLDVLPFPIVRPLRHWSFRAPKAYYHPSCLYYAQITAPTIQSLIPQLGRSSSGSSSGVAGWHLALQTEAREPSGIVELSIVGLDLAEVIGKDHVVDTND